MNTAHYEYDKNILVRKDIINKYIGYGTEIFRAELDKGHKNGTEIHIVTDSGIIKIYNARTKRHITDIIARPSQIKRVYHAKNMYAPRWLIEIAIENQNHGWNLV